MNLLSGFDRPRRRLGWALAGLCTALLAGCQTQMVVLSPPMHTRVVDGDTKKPIEGVRVTLVSLDGPETVTAYSDRAGYVDMPGLAAQPRTLFEMWANTPRAAVRAVFERPGYEPYAINSVNGYGFFRGHTDVHLYRE